MGQPLFVTLTGFDNGVTDYGRMERLSLTYPIEWGVLFSEMRQGQPRYPTFHQIRALLDWRARFNPQFPISAHICGLWAKDITHGRPAPAIVDYVKDFTRVQINHAGELIPSELNNCIEWAARLDGKPAVIVQTRELRVPAYRGVTFLYDPSGGRGREPGFWPDPSGAGDIVGYAGGLNVYNVRDIIQRNFQSHHYYWLDVETGLRIDNRFSLDLCGAFCDAVYGPKGGTRYLDMAPR